MTNLKNLKMWGMIKFKLNGVVAPLRSKASTANGLGQSSTPSHNLPPEVLIVIFEDAISQGFDRPPAGRCFVTLMGLTQVCSYWRRVAVSAPSLWNRINLPSRDAHLLDMHIQRSQNTGLDIYVHYFSDEARNLEFDAFLSKYMHRTRSLHILLHYPRTQVLPSGVSQSLINLSVEYPLYLTYYNTKPSFRMLTQAPSLRQVSLSSVKWWITPSNLASLTHLVLTGQSDSDKLDLPDLLKLLSQSPGLVELETDVIAPSTPDFTREGGRIFCPNLRRLQLQSFTRTPSQYPLLHLEAPSLRTLIMKSHVKSFPPTSELLPTTLIDFSVLDVHAARVTHPIQGTISLHLYSDAGFENEVFMHTHDVPYNVNIAVRDFFPEVIRTHGLISITSLLIRCDLRHSYLRFDPALELQYLETLRDIRVIQFECSDHANAYSLGSDFFAAVIHMQQQRNSLILPKLEKLTFSVSSVPSTRPYNMRTNGYDTEMWPQDTVLALGELMAFLRARAKHRKVLKELVIHWKAVRGEPYPWNARELASLVDTLRFFD